MPQDAATETRGLRGGIRRARPLIAFIIEIGVIAAAALVAFLLRFDFSLPGSYISVLIRAATVWAPVKLVCFKVFGLDRRWARYVSINDLLRVVLSNSIGSFVSLLILWAIKSGVPRSIYAIDWLVCVMLTASVRVSVRVIAESRQRQPAGQDRKRTIIYGAGRCGRGAAAGASPECVADLRCLRIPRRQSAESGIRSARTARAGQWRRSGRAGAKAPSRPGADRHSQRFGLADERDSGAMHRRPGFRTRRFRGWPRSSRSTVWRVRSAMSRWRICWAGFR